MSDTERLSGKPIPLEARLVAESKDAQRVVGISSDASPEPVEPDGADLSVGIRSMRKKKLRVSRPAHVRKRLADIRLPFSRKPRRAPSAESTEAVIPTDPASSVSQGPPGAAINLLELDSLASEKLVDPVDDEVLIQIDEPESDSRESDRRFLARFYGGCVAVLGLVSFVPSIVLLAQWNDIDNAYILPRWMYLLIFVGAIHLVYAVYLLQVPDWSSLWATSILTLAITTLYGFVAAGLWLDDGHGVIPRFLQLPSTLMRTAIIWCSLMLSLTALVSYLFGRDAMNWHRGQRLLHQSVAAKH